MFKKFRLFMGILGLFIIFVAASTSDTNPDWSLRSIFLMASGGLLLFYWGLRPHMDPIRLSLR